MRYHILYKDNKWDLYAKGIWVLNDQLSVAIEHVLVNKTILSIVPESTVIDFTNRAVNKEELNYQSSIISTNVIPSNKSVTPISKPSNIFAKIGRLLT